MSLVSSLFTKCSSWKPGENLDTIRMNTVSLGKKTISKDVSLHMKRQFVPYLYKKRERMCLYTMFSYGIGGKTLKWINTFLCYRHQRVVVNGVKSDWAPVVSGVQQGTVLGPLLFSLHINDITADIESEIRLFADDCVCYREIKDKEDTLKLQRDIDQGWTQRGCCQGGTESRSLKPSGESREGGGV